MAKANDKPKKMPFAYILCAIIAIPALIGSYFIGYTVGNNQSSNGGNKSEIAAVWKRSYYKSNGGSVDSYVILKADGGCRYIESWNPAYSASLNLDEIDEDCSYTYENGEGVITKSYYQYEYVDENTNRKTDIVTHTQEYNFSYQNGVLLVGGSVYNKLK